MTLLENHLEQISLSATAISDLPFPPPRIFTNALLQPHDITTLIRDTEAHERALFSVTGGPDLGPRQIGAATNNARTTAGTGGPDRRQTSRNRMTRPYRRQNAVDIVLGGDMVERIKKADSTAMRDDTGYRERAELDVDILLTGAEKLCGVYPISGASQKISSLRARYSRLKSSIEHYEAVVAQLSGDVDRNNRTEDKNGDMMLDDNDASHVPSRSLNHNPGAAVTEEDLKREEEEIKALERKKREMEERVSGMERDLGGLLR